MRKLEKHARRFITPTLLIDGEMLIGFGPNLGRIRLPPHFAHPQGKANWATWPIIRHAG